MKGIWSVLVILFCISGSASAMPGLDGHYHGTNGNESVSAVLETMTTTVTGMLTIGEKQYLLQAEASQDSYKGQLSSMTSGDSMPFQFSKSGDGLNVEIHSPSNGTVRFLLQPDR